MRLYRCEARKLRGRGIAGGDDYGSI